jgi:N utilization substance protein A
MNKEFLTYVELVANEKDLNPETILKAVEEALALGEDEAMARRVFIDRETGEQTTYRCWTVVEDDCELVDINTDLTLSEAQKKYPKMDLKVGSVIEEKIPNAIPDRIVAQRIKNIFYKDVRHAVLERMAQRYEERVGEMIQADVKMVYSNDRAILNLGDAEAELPRKNMLPGERLVANQGKIHVVIESVGVGADPSRGPVIIVTRRGPELLRELFKREVVEISEGLVQIKAVARDPGVRSKIAVSTNDGRVDPVGACVGPRGSRVQHVSESLGGERVDIILYNDNPAQFVINALAPAEVKSVVVDEANYSMDIAVDESQLAMAIGRNGQNVRLAAELAFQAYHRPWELNVMSEAALADNQLLEMDKFKSLFQTKLGLDEEAAKFLVEKDFRTIEEVAFASLDGGEFDAETVHVLEQIQGAAREVLRDEELDDLFNDPELAALDGVTPEMLAVLTENAILKLEDLANLSTDELLDIFPELDVQVARDLIMQARDADGWFAKE